MLDMIFWICMSFLVRNNLFYLFVEVEIFYVSDSATYMCKQYVFLVIMSILCDWNFNPTSVIRTSIHGVYVVAWLFKLCLYIYICMNWCSMITSTILYSEMVEYNCCVQWQEWLYFKEFEAHRILKNWTHKFVEHFWTCTEKTSTGIISFILVR